MRGIWRMNSDGTGLEHLTADWTSSHKLAWSPDSRQIAYLAEKMVHGKRYFAIKVVDVKRKTSRQVTDFQRFLSDPRWISLDGTIAFQRDRNGTLSQAHGAPLVPSEIETEILDRMATTSHDLQIWVSRPDGGDRILISRLGERALRPILSPDGRRVCYSSSDSGGSISVAETDGTHRINLGFGSSPSWSPDGLWLVYEVTEDDGHDLIGSDLYIIGVDGEGRVQLTDTPDLIERWPTWSPDGTQVAFCAGGSIYTLSVPQSATSGD